MPSILFATNSDKLSGGSRQLVLAANTLAEMGYGITVLAPTGRKLTADLNYAVRLVPFGKRLRLGAIRQILPQTAPAVVHCFHGQVYKSFLLAKLFGAQFRLYLNRGVIFVPGSFPLFYLPQLDGLICNSQAAAQVLHRLWVPKGKIHVVPNAIAALPITPPEVHNRPQPPWITFVGGTKPYKGLDIFLAAMARLAALRHDFQAHIVGAAWHPRWKTFLGAAQTHCHFHGALPHEEVLRILCATSIFVLSSRQESQPNALLEAMACGAAPVATAVGGVSEILTHGENGIFVPPEDPEAIAMAVNRLLDLPSERASIATAAQRRIQDFSPRTRAQHLLEVYGL